MKLISTSTHLSWETIKAYLENKLSRTETHAVEEHLLDCSFCSEAIEGLSRAPLAENEKNISEIWAKIDTAVNHKTKKRFFLYQYRYWAVAASLLLALGLVLVLLLTKPNFETGGNAQLAQKNTPTQENKDAKSTETNTKENLEEADKKPLLEEKKVSVMDNLEEKANSVLEKTETAKPVFSKKESLSEEKSMIENSKPILQEKESSLAGALEENPISEEKANAGKKPLEKQNLEKNTLAKEENMADKNLEKNQKTAVLEEKSKTAANNIIQTPQNEDADLALRSQKNTRKKQNSAKIIQKSEAKKEEQVALDSLSVKKDKETDQIVEKKSVVLPFEMQMLKPNLGVVLDSLRVDFAKIEYKNMPQNPLPIEIISLADDRTHEQAAKVEPIGEIQNVPIQENKPQEIGKGETQEAKVELQVEKTQDKKIEISPKDSVETKVQIELPAEAPVSPEGGWDKFQEYLKNNLQYPEDAKRSQIQGMVRIEILIDAEGKIKDLEIKRGLIESCNQEAIRLVKNYKWLAARQNGIAVEERITVRVSFE